MVRVRSILLATALLMSNPAFAGNAVPEELLQRAVVLKDSTVLLSDCFGVALPGRRVLTFPDCVAGVGDISFFIDGEVPGVYRVEKFLGPLQQESNLVMVEIDRPLPLDGADVEVAELAADDDEVWLLFLGRSDRFEVKKVRVQEREGKEFETEATNFWPGIPDSTVHVWAFDRQGRLVGRLVEPGIWSDDFEFLTPVRSLADAATDEEKGRFTTVRAFLGLGGFAWTPIPGSENHPLWFPLRLGVHYRYGSVGYDYNLVDHAHKVWASHPFPVGDWTFHGTFGVRTVEFEESGHVETHYAPELKWGVALNSWATLSLVLMPTVGGVGVAFP